MADHQFTIALVQMRCSADKTANLAKAEAAIADAAKQGAQVVCLPELFLGPYFCQREDAALFDLAEPIPGPSSERLATAAKQNKVVVVGSLFEKRMPGVYHNTATVHDANGQYLGMYRKMHIPDDPLYFEKYYFTPGDLGFRSSTQPGEGWHARLLGSVVPRGGPADGSSRGGVIFYLIAIGWHPKKRPIRPAQHASGKRVCAAMPCQGTLLAG